LANQQHIEILCEGVDAWNRWREQNPEVRPDLRKAKLANRDLSGVDLSNADLDFAELTSVILVGARLDGADMYRANLSPTPLEVGESRFVPTNLTDASLVGARLHDAALTYTLFVGADLTDAQLWWTHAFRADFSDATLVRAEITEARLHFARFIGANLTDAYLSESNLNQASFEDSTLTGCNVYGSSAWDVRLNGAIQEELVITPPSADDPHPTITVDNLEVAQFIYLLINNERVRHVIDTVTSKVVLILGRFTHAQKAVLDALREELRRRDYVPVMFDFESPSSRDLTETVSTLAHMARFVIVDLTDPRSVPQELSHIVPNLPSVPIQPLLAASASEYGMFEHFKHYPWVLKPYHYENLEHLLDNLAQEVVAPAESKVEELGNREW